MRVPRMIILLIIVLLFLGIGVSALMNVNNNVGYAPTQPIPFSHKLHAGQYNIPCMYCHTGVEKSKHATVPSMNMCMNCHSVVKPDSPHIKRMKELYNDKKESFEWIKVHDLPDHVNFNHKRHVAKGITCETCHGDVKRMEKIRQDKPLTMGWCLDCHRGDTAPAHLKKKSEDAALDNHPGTTGHGGTSGIAKGGVAPTSCYTCHQ